MALDTDVLGEMGLSAAEEKFVKSAGTPYTHEINESLVISNLFLAKAIERSASKTVESIERNTSRTIESNTYLAEASDTNSRRMLWLTVVLTIVTAAQGIIAFASMREQRLQSVRDRSIAHISELLAQLKDAQRTLINPQFYTDDQAWKAAIQAHNGELERTFGSALMFLSDEEGRDFAEFSDAEVALLKETAFTVGKSGRLKDETRARYSERFHKSIESLARHASKRLEMSAIGAGEGKK